MDEETEPREVRWVAEVIEQVSSRDSKKIKGTLPLQEWSQHQRWQLWALLSLVVGDLWSCFALCALPKKAPQQLSSSPFEGLEWCFPWLSLITICSKWCHDQKSWLTWHRPSLACCPVVTNCAPFCSQKCQVCTINHVIPSPKVYLVELYPVQEKMCTMHTTYRKEDDFGWPHPLFWWWNLSLRAGLLWANWFLSFPKCQSDRSLEIVHWWFWPLLIFPNLRASLSVHSLVLLQVTNAFFGTIPTLSSQPP